jgi:drug/metabolite transporter (DMT)-like permease
MTIGEMLVGRLEGPLTLRLVLQPAMAAFFAVRAGLKDARQGRRPYLWKMVTNPELRRELLRLGWKDVRFVFLMAVLLDCVYQVIVFKWIYLAQAAIVAILLALVPYGMIRGPVNRLMSRRRRSSRTSG